jgi:hypothetical protein
LLFLQLLERPFSICHERTQGGKSERGQGKSERGQDLGFGVIWSFFARVGSGLRIQTATLRLTSWRVAHMQGRRKPAIRHSRAP